MRRALIGIDGNCGFAGLGELPTAPAGEWVFIEIDGPVDPYDDPYSGPCAVAVAKALAKLRENVAPESITYELDPSHPRYIG